MWGIFERISGGRRRLLLKIILFMLILVFFLSCCFAVQRAKKVRKASVSESAAVCAGLIEKRIAEQRQDGGDTFYPADGPEGILSRELPFDSPLSTFAVLKDGQVLYAEGYSPLSWKLVASVSGLARTASSSAQDLQEAQASSVPVYTYSDHGLPDYYFCYIPSQVDGLSYCYYEPALAGWPLIMQSFFNIRGLLPLLPLTAMLPVLFLLFVPSKKGVKNQAAGIADFHKNSRPEIEISKDRIKENETQQDLENKVQQNISTQSAQALNQKTKKKAIPKGDNSKTAEPEDSDIFGSRPYFSGIIIDYHNINGDSISPDVLELFDRIIRENLSVNKILFQLSSQRSSDCLQYYMNYNNYNLRVLCDSLKMNLYNAAPEYAINIFYSDAVSTRQEMENELLYLHCHLRYSLLLGYGFRFSIKQIRAFENSAEKMDVAVANTIQNHLRTRAYEDLYGYLRRCRDTCTHFARPGITVYSFSEMYRFAEESFSAVKLFFQENSFSHPMVESSCSTVLRANPGFGHFCDYLISCIRNYQQENQHLLSSRNEQIMNSIYMYIEQDLADANLNSIARKMQMTDSHLSRVFKKNTGTNFSEYLSDRKLEEAAKLLVQDNKIKVADIADMLGYGNPTYFLSRFKAKYGVSPTAYRKTHMTDAN